MTIYAEILTIGDEILYGQILNTNAQWLSTEMSNLGVRVIHHTTVSDQEKAILDALSLAESRADIVLITGGLGPTKDDITKKTLAKYFNSEMVMDEGWLKKLEDYFSKRGRPMVESNRLQASIPKVATLLENRLGTAPGMWFEQNGKVFVSMPGIPHEMEALMKDHVILRLRNVFTIPFIHHKVIHTVAIGEAFLAERIAEWEDQLPPHIRLAYLPHHFQVRLRLTGTGIDQHSLIQEVEHEASKVIPLIEKHIFGYGDITLEDAIGNLLLEKAKTIATAESCTGGYLAHAFTKIAGSSRYYIGGIVAYSNEVKIKQLGVKSETLEAHGAVSEETIREMAEGVRKALGTDIGVATSGIAGPDGGSEQKPVGTIWIALADEKGTYSQKLQLPFDRLRNIYFTTVLVLDLIRRKVLDIEI
jgi:nicotinamide-nucleotide amidase